MRCSRLVLSSALVFGALGHIRAQEIVSATAGVVQYFEGSVFVDDHPIEHKSSVFTSLKNGSNLRTEKGRAELLLSPGVFLRLDEKSSVRMLSNSLADTRLELLAGSAIVDNLEAKPDHIPVLVYKDFQVRFPKPGIYRLNCELEELEAYRGEAEVSHRRATVTVDSLHLYFFMSQLRTGKLDKGDMDEFYDWARNRGTVLSEENQLTAASGGNPDDADMSAGAFPIPSVPNYPLSTPSYSMPNYAQPGSFPPSYYPYSYLYSPASSFAYAPFSPLVILVPYRHRPGMTNWPINTKNHSGAPPGIARWPITNGVLSHPPIRNGGYYHPISPVMPRPLTPSMPRPGSVAVPHPPAAHVGVAGHR